jgi:hypothetical protein
LQFRFEEEAITKCDIQVWIYTIVIFKYFITWKDRCF